MTSFNRMLTDRLIASGEFTPEQARQIISVMIAMHGIIEDSDIAMFEDHQILPGMAACLGLLMGQATVLQIEHQHDETPSLYRGNDLTTQVMTLATQTVVEHRAQQRGGSVGPIAVMTMEQFLDAMTEGIEDKEPDNWFKLPTDGKKH